ncbi:MAG: hypothetical protein VX549_14385 [Pseudomonadota bacterium]|nr:hypothetical protein [Pseudomonadota bacterium]
MRILSFAISACLASTVAQAGPVGNLLGALSGGDSSVSTSQQSSAGAVPLLGATVASLQAVNNSLLGGMHASGAETSGTPLPGLARADGPSDGLLGLSIFEVGPDGSGYPVLLQLGDSTVDQPLADLVLGQMLGLGGENNLIDVALLGGNQVGNTGDDGLLGAAVLSGSDAASGGLLGIGILNDNNTGTGELLGLAALSGDNAGQGGALGVGVLNGDNSGHGDALALGVLSGENSGQSAEGLGIGLLNDGDALHIMYDGDVLLSLDAVGSQLEALLPIGEVYDGIWIGTGEDVTSSNDLINIGVLAGDNAGSGGLIGVAVLSGDNAAQGSLIGLGVLNGDNSGTSDGIGVAALSGDNSGLGTLGVGVLNGDNSGNGSVIGAGILNGDDSGNGGQLGVGVLNGDNAGNGGTIGAGVLNGDGSGNGGSIGAGVLNGDGSGNGGDLGIGIGNGDDSGQGDSLGLGLINDTDTSAGGDGNGNGNGGGDGGQGSDGEPPIDLANNPDEGSTGADSAVRESGTDLLCGLTDDIGERADLNCSDAAAI